MLKNYGYLLKSLDMNKINQLFAERQGRKLLSLYFCAGCPTLEGTADVIKTLERRGIDMIEVGSHLAVAFSFSELQYFITIIY